MRSLVLASLLFVACGSDDDAGNNIGGAATQTDVDSSCSANCAAQKKCISTVDETTCNNGCKNQLAAVGTKVRADYMLGIGECSKTAACDKLKDCNDTAKASIAPTAAAQTYCDDLIKKNAECKFGTTDKAKCLEDSKVFADATLDAARTCLTKSCGDYIGCVTTTFGLR